MFCGWDIRKIKKTALIKQGLSGYLHYVKVAVRTGLEPATSCVTGRHSNQLNYRTTYKEMIGINFEHKKILCKNHRLHKTLLKDIGIV